MWLLRTEEANYTHRPTLELLEGRALEHFFQREEGEDYKRESQDAEQPDFAHE